MKKVTTIILSLILLFAFSGNAIAATDSSDLSTKPLLLDDTESISSNFVNIPINNLNQADKILDSIGVQEETSKYVEKIINNKGMLGNQRVKEITIYKPILSPILAAKTLASPGYGGYNYKEDTVVISTTPCGATKFVSKKGKNNFINEKIEKTAIFVLQTVADSYSCGSISILQWFGDVFGPDAYPNFTYDAYVRVREDKTVRFTYCEKIPNAGYLLGCQTEQSTFYAEPQVTLPNKTTKVGKVSASTVGTPAFKSTTKRQQLAVSYYGAAPHYIERVNSFRYESFTYGSVRY